VDPNLIQNLDSMWSMGMFVSGMMVVAAVSGWLWFGRQASDEILARHSFLRNPVFYFAATGMGAVLLVVVYVIVSFLSGFSELLALVLAAFLLLYRVNSSNVWTTITGSERSNAWITRLGLSLPVITLLIAWLVGVLPSFSAGEWAIVTLYALVVWVAMVGPLGAVVGQTDDTLETMGIATGVSEELADRQAAIADRAPPAVDVDVWEHTEISTVTEAESVLDTFKPAEEWVDVYDDYVDVRLELEDELPDSVRKQALAADDDLDTRVSTIAENLRPDQYDDPENATKAVETLAHVVDRYQHDHLPAGFPQDDDVLQTDGPVGPELERIKSRADEIPA